MAENTNDSQQALHLSFVAAGQAEEGRREKNELKHILALLNNQIVMQRHKMNRTDT